MARRPEEANQGREPRGGACPTDHRRTLLGHPGDTSNRLSRQGLGRLLTILPWYPLASNLACINEATPRGESPEATRPDTSITVVTDTLAHGHARASQCDQPRGHIDKPRSECEPRGFHTQEVRTPLIDNHAPSGWLFDRVSGLRARTWYPDVAPRTSPLVSIYGGFPEQTVCEQHRFLFLRVGCEDISILRSRILDLHIWGCMLGLKSAEQIIRASDKISLDCLGRPWDRTAQGIYSAAHSLENRHAAAV